MSPERQNIQKYNVLAERHAHLLRWAGYQNSSSAPVCK